MRKGHEGPRRRSCQPGVPRSTELVGMILARDELGVGIGLHGVAVGRVVLRSGQEGSIEFESPIATPQHRLRDDGPCIRVTENAAVLLEAAGKSRNRSDLGVVFCVARSIEDRAVLCREVFVNRVHRFL